MFNCNPNLINLWIIWFNSVRVCHLLLKTVECVQFMCSFYCYLFSLKLSHFLLKMKYTETDGNFFFLTHRPVSCNLQTISEMFKSFEEGWYWVTSFKPEETAYVYDFLNAFSKKILNFTERGTSRKNIHEMNVLCCMQ